MLSLSPQHTHTLFISHSLIHTSTIVIHTHTHTFVFELLILIYPHIYIHNLVQMANTHIWIFATVNNIPTGYTYTCTHTTTIWIVHTPPIYPHIRIQTQTHPLHNFSLYLSYNHFVADDTRHFPIFKYYSYIFIFLSFIKTLSYAFSCSHFLALINRA